MLEADPSLTPSEIKAVLQSTAARLPTSSPRSRAQDDQRGLGHRRVARKRSTPLRKEVVGA